MIADGSGRVIARAYNEMNRTKNKTAHAEILAFARAAGKVPLESRDLMAKAGLDSWGVPAEESDRYLGIIEQRCLRETSGAEWFIERVRARGGEDRYDTLRATLLDYRDRMHTNEPVHLWD